jgi:hypothetical protein
MKHACGEARRTLVPVEQRVPRAERHRRASGRQARGAADRSGGSENRPAPAHPGRSPGHRRRKGLRDHKGEGRSGSQSDDHRGHPRKGSAPLTRREIPCVRSEYHFVEVRLSEARSGAAALAACLAHPTRGHTGFAKLMVWSFLVGFPERPGPDTLSRFVEQGTAKSGAEA